MDLRLEQINKVRENGGQLLKLKKVNEPYGRFHMDANSPSGDDYWAYQYFLDYYRLDKNVIVELVP